MPNLLPKNSKADFKRLGDRIFQQDANVRFAGIIGEMGRLEAGGMRKGVSPLEEDKDAQRVYLDFALRSAMRHDFDPVFGRVLYAFSERERIKFASFPLTENNILLVSIEKGKPHNKTIGKVLKLINEQRLDSPQNEIRVEK